VKVRGPYFGRIIKSDLAKCDEHRPICRLCAVSDRDCSFAANQQKQPIVTSEPNQNSSFGEYQDHDLNARESQKAAPLTPVSNANPPGHPLLQNNYDARLDSELNLDHMELLIHLTQDSDMFNLGVGIDSNHASDLALGLKEALKAPYLMHELLAFSAQHLAHLHPARSLHYLHQTMSLQTRAISLFNATWSEVDGSNCVAVVLFSSVLGHHLLADTLSKRDVRGLEAFVAHYVQCVEIHRGIYTIAKSAWPLLMESELEPIMSMSSNFTSQTPVGNDCQSVQDLVDIQYLQVGFDAVALGADHGYNRHHMIYTWTMLVPLDVTNMLASKQPEVLILLAYYAVLLHRGKDLWQVGNAGEYIFDLIAKYLGSEWEIWLRDPRRMISDGLSS
jgi:hypothetical protein